MEQPANPVSADPVGNESQQANATLAAVVERLKELGLYDEQGRVVVEPAVTFSPA
jgi:hypothetical protein